MLPLCTITLWHLGSDRKGSNQTQTLSASPASYQMRFDCLIWSVLEDSVLNSLVWCSWPIWKLLSNINLKQPQLESKGNACQHSHMCTFTHCQLQSCNLRHFCCSCMLQRCIIKPVRETFSYLSSSPLLAVPLPSFPFLNVSYQVARFGWFE